MTSTTTQVINSDQLYWPQFQRDQRGHTWKTHGDNYVDLFGANQGICNGPICVTCGYGECWCSHEYLDGEWPRKDCTNGKR